MSNYNLNGANYIQSMNYQTFVVNKLIDYGIIITLYTTKEEQFNIGESVEGYEIKLDKKFRKTGNLYIEVAEKTNPLNKEYYPSGIKRTDNTKFYCIGDEEILYIFDKKYLKKLVEKRSETRTLTSIGVLLPISELKENKFLEIIDFSIDPFWYKLANKK